MLGQLLVAGVEAQDRILDLADTALEVVGMVIPILGAFKVEVMRPVPDAVSAVAAQRHIGPLMVYKPTASSWQTPVVHSVTQTGNGPCQS